MKPTNPKAFNAVLRWLDAGAPHKGDVDGFDMRDFKRQRDRGTTCCIAGAMVEFSPTLKKHFTGDLSYPYIASIAAGMEHEDPNILFYGLNGCGEDEDLESITPAWAARCIRHYIETGTVDWDGTREAKDAAPARPEKQV